METLDLFTAADPRDGGSLDDYVAIRVDEAAADPALVEDLRGILAATWLAEVLRHDFEQACFGARVYGPLGTFEGVVADDMPGYWRRVEGVLSAGTQVWLPDGRHPLGKFMADMAARLLPLPSLEVLDAVLRRHGIEGSKEPLPVMKEGDGFLALLVHKPKAKSFTRPGVSRDDAVRALWR